MNRYHVYAEDGFESSHRSQAAAERAAKRGHQRRGVHYEVVQTSAYGLTGGGHGARVYSTRGT
jgi:hypothetical protein